MHYSSRRHFLSCVKCLWDVLQVYNKILSGLRRMTGSIVRHLREIIRCISWLQINKSKLRCSHTSQSYNIVSLFKNIVSRSVGEKMEIRIMSCVMVLPLIFVPIVNGQTTQSMTMTSPGMEITTEEPISPTVPTPGEGMWRLQCHTFIQILFHAHAHADPHKRTSEFRLQAQLVLL